jgi:citrate synthase
MMSANLAAPRNDGELLSAEDAAARLGVRKATLYAYVSRGLITAMPDPQQPKFSRYATVELDRLREGAYASKRTAPHPQSTLYDGLPLVTTALSGIVDGEMLIRGQPLLAWAQHASLEDTAALLWACPVDAAFNHPAPNLPSLWHDTARALQHTDPVVRAVTLWTLAMPHLRGEVDLQGDELAAALGEHLRVAFACWLARAPSTEPLHVQTAHAWRLTARTHDTLRQALVLCADMVGNLMSLSARMMASVQGSLAACLLSSMSYGFVRLSGGEFEAVEALFDEVEATGSLQRVAASYRARGEALPGINHHVFVRGDPRGTALLELATAAGSKAGHWLIAAQSGQSGPGGQTMQPALDFGLVALRRALKAPRHAALTLTHAPRNAGMLAQAVEQRQLGRRMWVQSNYLGPAARA